MSNFLDSFIITTLFESPEGDGISNQNYRDVILNSLRKILPSDFFEKKEHELATLAHQQNIIKQVIPLITYSSAKKFPGTLSFFTLSKYRPNSFKFFFEMISRWLAPGRRLNVVLVYASDFRLTHLSEEVYTICEIMISVCHDAEFEEIQRNFPIIGSEIALGIHSEFYAQRILEIKGLSTDDKTALVQSFIALLIQRFPDAYDYDIFTEMQHILVTCRDDFKAARKPRHLSRIISIQYLFRKSLKDAIKKKSERRHINLKIFRAIIQTPTGKKKVLGVLVGMNLFRDQEAFGEKHLLKAIQHYIPGAMAIDHSFLINKLGSENISIFYIELEKKDGSSFTSADIRKLRRELPENIKNRVEHRLHPVFMPRNEEEVMRNILILTNQIKYVRDIPQVLIMFDKQAYSHLYFTVILARILKIDSLAISDLFKQSQSSMEYLHDRTKIMGYVRKKYAKEATVFCLKLNKDHFLRADHSIDLYKARQMVIHELSEVIGEIRDYNGGMISKQHELLSIVRRLLLGDNKEYEELMLENFFYSLAPVVVRALVDPHAFKHLFIMLLEGLQNYQQEGYYLKFDRDSYNVFALMISEDHTIKDSVNRAIQELHIPSTELAYARIKTHGNTCMGYICCAHDSQKKEQFVQVIEQTLKTLEKNHSPFAHK